MASANWTPPGTIKPKSGGRSGDRLAADLLNDMGGAAARANKLDFGRPGIHTQSGFYSTETQQAAGSTMKIVLLLDALLPGTYDLPGLANGSVMQVSSGSRLTATSEVVSVVNYSTSIYGPIGGLVLCQTFNGLNVAVGSSG